MSQEIKDAVDQLLVKVGVTVVFRYVGESDTALHSGHAMDEWRATMCNSQAGKKANFEYFTGLGLRSPAPKPMNGGPMPRVNTLMWEQLQKARKPQEPNPADLLYSLLMEGDAVSQSFESWCADIGCNPDSRKDYAIYEACQKNTDKLASVIGQKTREALREALQDY